MARLQGGFRLLVVMAGLSLLGVVLPVQSAAVSPPQVTAVAGGRSSGYALESNGSVWAWGDNCDGELGNPAVQAQYSSLPAQVHGLTGVTAIASGGYCGYALKSDGTVWSWGSNFSGELGSGGTSVNSSVPVQVYGLSGVTAIASGGQSGYALASDGTVWAWGDNYYGELGNGNASNSSLPVQVRGLTGVAAIAGGGSSGYALESDGTVWAWGSNFSGELGNGSTSGSSVPVRVHGLTGVTAIAGGRSSGYALQPDGTVWSWGDNDYGELGNGSTSGSSVPVQVHGLTGITAIAGRGRAGYALASDGTVWAWGYNGDGQLGILSNYNSSVATQVYGLTSVTAIAGGGQAGYAVKPDGTVWAWGYNGDGQLGTGDVASISVPVQVKVPATLPVLRDLAGNWARADVEKLLSLGVLSGYPDGTFRPDDLVTRAEFVTAVVKAFNTSTHLDPPLAGTPLPGGYPAPKPGKTFADTAQSWARDYIATATADGIVEGYDDSSFGPADPVTREQVAVILVRAAKLSPVGGPLGFIDSARVDPWAEKDVVTAAADGIIKGFPDGSFRPGAYTTRAEAAAAIVRALSDS